MDNALPLRSSPPSLEALRWGKRVTQHSWSNWTSEPMGRAESLHKKLDAFKSLLALREAFRCWDVCNAPTPWSRRSPFRGGKWSETHTWTGVAQDVHKDFIGVCKEKKIETGWKGSWDRTEGLLAKHNFWVFRLGWLYTIFTGGCWHLRRALASLNSPNPLSIRMNHLSGSSNWQTLKARAAVKRSGVWLEFDGLWCVKEMVSIIVIVISCDVFCWRATPQESQHYSCCHHITYEDEAACQLVVLYHRAKRKEKREYMYESSPTHGIWRKETW